MIFAIALTSFGLVLALDLLPLEGLPQGNLVSRLVATV